MDPKNCDLQNHASFKFKENPRVYSYAACGYVDTFSRDPEKYEVEEIKIVKHENYRGYQGTICHDKEGTFMAFDTDISSFILFFSIFIFLVHQFSNLCTFPHLE